MLYIVLFQGENNYLFQICFFSQLPFIWSLIFENMLTSNDKEKLTPYLVECFILVDDSIYQWRTVI